MMKTLTPTELMSKEEWLKYRSMGIGGSDVAVICGMSKYKSLFQLWAEKTGNYNEEETENEFMYWGRSLEPVIRNEFVKRTGFTITLCSSILQHQQYTFMLANIDGIVNTNDGEYIFEAKTANAYKTDEWRNVDYVPYSYQLQLQHYMAITGLKGAYIAVLIGGNQFRHYFIERDDELIAMIIKLEQQFWSYVENKTPPAIDGSEPAKVYLNSLFPTSEPKKTIMLSESCLKFIEDYENYEADEKYCREQKEKCANELKLLIGDNECAKIADRLVTWKTVSQERLDVKRLASELPDTYEKYLNKSSYRRFTVKSKKGE